jgi:DNA-binding beta-propeller fold protein YncE
VTNVTTGFTSPYGILYDGANIWVTDPGTGSLKKLDSNGHILMSVPVGSGPVLPVFDGENIWVPNVGSNSVSVVRASGGLAGTVLATLTGNGLNGPAQAAFDGERILVTNSAGNSVSLWRASDLAPIGTFSAGTSSSPFGACSDGLNFWITLQSAGQLARL